MSEKICRLEINRVQEEHFGIWSCKAGAHHNINLLAATPLEASRALHGCRGERVGYSTFQINVAERIKRYGEFSCYGGGILHQNINKTFIDLFG